MLKISVPNNSLMTNLKDVLQTIFEDGEVIESHFGTANLGARYVGSFTGFASGAMTSFSDYALDFKVIVTNHRLLLIGEVPNLNMITGIRSIQYDEIVKFHIDNDEKPGHLFMELRTGETYELLVASFKGVDYLTERNVNGIATLKKHLNKETKNEKNNNQILTFTYVTVLVIIFAALVSSIMNLIF